MKQFELQEILNDFIENEQNLFVFKQDEYNRYNDDVLKSFKQIAVMTGLKPSVVCLILMMKHIQNIASTIVNDDVEERWFIEKNGKEGLKQRLMDVRNYLLLLAGCIEDELKEKHIEK